MTSSVSVINIAAKIMKIHPRSVILISLSQLLSFSVDVVDIVLPVKDCVQDKRVFGETFNTEHYEDIKAVMDSSCSLNIFCKIPALVVFYKNNSNAYSY